MIRTEQDAISTLAKKTAQARKDIRQDKNQRRNQVVDLFGIEYTRQGDTTHPATFYISVSRDLIYYERFEFKIILGSFMIPVAGGGTTSETIVTVDNTSLTTNGTIITPNPHTHTTQPHDHALSPGISIFQSQVSNLEMWIEGVNVTQYLKDQHNGNWIEGEGIFPGSGFEVYDILDIAGKLPKWQKGAVMQPGYKKVEIRADGIFNVTLVNYFKYNHTNR